MIRSVASMLGELEQIWRGRIGRIEELLPDARPTTAATPPRRTEMSVVQVDTDLEHRTLTITARFTAPVERVWAIYADPARLEKVWGPPTYPATSVAHSLTPGGQMHNS
ncbi:MAG: hypothetical protein ABI360_03260 [Allobranchiibius sp.]